MREILFRGKVADLPNSWVYGYLVREDTIYQCDKQYFNGFCALGTFSVIPETIGQYTGFVDKNGTKIFEGDIVTLFDEKSVVKTSEMRASFGLYKISNGMFYEMIHKNDQKWLEVIGNIYDNPELLDEVR
jgi:uncharacterized phage protein (TIGR01671 family)